MLYEFVGKNGCYYKLNANCKQEEKSGSGPGSCGGSKTENKHQIYSIMNDHSKISQFRYHKLKREGGVFLPNDPAINKSIMRSSNSVLKSLSKDDIKKIKEYTGTWGYADVYNYLMTDHKYSTQEDLTNGKKIIDVLDNAISKSELPKGTILWKGINNTKDINLPESNFEVGKTFSYDVFNSFSLSPDIAEMYATSNYGGYSKEKNPIIIEAEFPEGGNGLLLNSKSTVNEPYDKNYDNRIHEVIIPRKQKFEIVSVKQTEKGKLVKAIAKS